MLTIILIITSVCKLFIVKFVGILSFSQKNYELMKIQPNH